MESITRKEFVKHAALGSAAAMGASALASVAVASEASPAEAVDDQPFELGVEWDAEYDVVVVGSGFAGLMTAAAAADAGQRVLVVEKAPYAERGGNSRVTCGAYTTYYPENRDAFIGYMRSVCGMYDTPDIDMITAFADAVIRVPDWMNERGANETILNTACGSYPQYEGCDAVNFHCEDGKLWDAGIYNALSKIVDSYDSIDIWYSTPAKRFIQDPATKVVHGVTVEHEGTEYNVRAMDGVADCAGGFAANNLMVQDYLRFPYACPLGSTYNTGDGIKMATAVGADLWHMCATDGPDYNVQNPLTGASFSGGTIRIRGHHDDVRESSGFTCLNAIIVGADGTRFCDEGTLPDHGFEDYHGRLIFVNMSLPAYIVFDQTAFDAQPIYPVWETNDEQLEEGVIISAETLEELNEKMKIQQGTLAATVEQYNGYCAQGSDPDFNRAAEYLLPIETGPFYAVEIMPSIVNTQGGPKRNAQAQIIDVEGNPIPHLYGAGECGSMWSDVYQGGGNIAECLAFGLIAGEQLAVKATDNYRESVMDGKDPIDFTEELVRFEPEADNEFIGLGYGIGGPLWVKVVMDGQAIQDIEVLWNLETPRVGSKAIEALPAKMVEAQGVEVDDFTGATSTSQALKAAVSDALAKAGVVSAEA